MMVKRSLRKIVSVSDISSTLHRQAEGKRCHEHTDTQACTHVELINYPIQEPYTERSCAISFFFSENL